MTVFTKAEHLLDYTFQMTDSVKRYPKKYRFTFVNRINDLALDICINLRKCNELPVKKKRDLQINILADIEGLLTLIELSLQRKFIDHDQCSRWTSKVVDVKNLTGAWLKVT